MKYFELQDETEIQQVINEHWHSFDDNILPPLFHGTDSSLIGMPRQERTIINEACEVIIKSIYELFKKNSISITDKVLMSVKDSYGDAANAYVKAGGRINSSYLYRYGDFYVTNNPRRAIGYSKESWIFGETGEVANLLVEGAYALGLALPEDSEFTKAYKIYDDRKKRIKDPIVIVITDCKCTELLDIKGVSILDDKDGVPIDYVKYIKEKSICDSFIISEDLLVNDNDIYTIKPVFYEKLVQIYESM